LGHQYLTIPDLDLFLGRNNAQGQQVDPISSADSNKIAKEDGFLIKYNQKQAGRV
jgi:hypothetical protein